MSDHAIRNLFTRNIDMILVLAVVGILIAIFIPLPPSIIDLLLTINISIAVVILFTTFYVKEPLSFSVFPSLLLLTTTFRLGMNIATTRLILGRAHEDGTAAAGNVIEAFGQFVAGNQALIGFIIFVIIIVVQFVVITKGAGRVSEVAARFTLDAMPGKQMAIDADLNAGLINEIEAKERRDKISSEADFYGAMDGASKFVRGDAIAGIIITLINILGGFIMGVVVHGMPAGQSVETFILLSIGDGLVSQMPALIISLAAGIIVTRATSESDLGQDFLGQIFSVPKVLAITSGLLFFLAFTGLPFVPMIIMSAACALLAWQLSAIKQEKAVEDEKAAQAKVDAARPPEKVESLLQLDSMELEIGYGLIRLVDPNQGGTLLDKITMVRRQTAVDLGMIVPPIRIRDNMNLGPNEYILRIRGSRVADGTLMVDHYLAMNPGLELSEIEGIDTVEPAFQLPARWITEQQKQKAEALGYTVVDPVNVLITHVTELIKMHASELLTREDVNNLIQNLKESAPALVEEVVPAVLKVGEVQKVLERLLAENVSIRDLGTILEVLGDYGTKTKDPDVLTEYVRAGLGRKICEALVEPDGKLYVITVDPRLEQVISEGIERTDSGVYIHLNPDTINRIIETTAQELEKVLTQGHSPIVLCAPIVRGPLKRILDSARATLGPVSVLSISEIVSGVDAVSLGMITADQVLQT
jgi:flagellar biosynthesis protein FlhA